MKTVSFYVEKTPEGFSAYCDELDVASSGSTLEELYQNSKDGVEVQCECINEDPSQYLLRYTYGFIV